MLFSVRINIQRDRDYPAKECSLVPFRILSARCRLFLDFDSEMWRNKDDVLVEVLADLTDGHLPLTFKHERHFDV